MKRALVKVLITSNAHPHYNRVGLLTGITAKESDGYKEVILLPDGHHTLASPQQLKYLEHQGDHRLAP